MNRRHFLKAAALTGSFAFSCKVPAQDPGDAGLIGSSLAQIYEYQEFAEVTKTLPTSFIHPKASKSTAKVGVRLNCVFDVSGSINNEEHKLQLDAMSEAIGSKDFFNAIFYRGGPGSTAICVTDFSDDSRLRIGWIDIRDRKEQWKLTLLADEIRRLKRRISGSTYQTRALAFADECFKKCPWASDRSIVDIMTDGEETGAPASDKDTMGLVERLAVEHFATVNALITLDSNPDGFIKWCNDVLVTPAKYTRPNGTLISPGFVKTVATQQTDSAAVVKYQDALKLAFRQKLILEVAGIELDELHKIVAAENSHQASINTSRRRMFQLI